MNPPRPSAIESLARIIAEAPESEPAPTEPAPPPRDDFPPSTGVPKRYQPEWPHPNDDVWHRKLSRINARIINGGMAVLVGPRGTGKTRIALEAIRCNHRRACRYTTAMGLFLKIRATWGRGNASSPTSEADVIDEYSTAPILCIDEVQERGDTPWEDRLLTHIIDRRYGAMLPTLIIGNLEESALIECLGHSIISRLHETGGIIRMEGASHRVQS